MSRVARVFARRYATPPTYFANPGSVPTQFGEPAEPPVPERSKDRPLRDISMLLAVFTLAYLALDNYSGRLKLEKLQQETTAINLKTLQLQQQNFLNTRKQHELNMLRERMNTSKRCFKMALHIAMLRKQLEDLGAQPKEVVDVIAEFEQNVKINNSIQNLTGQALWLEDGSAYKGIVPDYHQYDKTSGKT